MKINIKMNGKGFPRIAIIGCVHGDELIGKKIINTLRRKKVLKGSLITIIANPLAVQKKKRFIDQDLNRSFPGKVNGNHEEKIAYELKNIISKVDYVIDIHSTTTDVKNLVIITKATKNVKNFVDLFQSKHTALMDKKLGKKSLTYYSKSGIVLEYGKDKSKNTYKNVYQDIQCFLKKIEMINTNVDTGKRIQNYYTVIGTLKKKNGYKCSRKIRNFKLVKKGDVFATNGVKKHKAPRNFYPMLFGSKSYKDIYGFMAKKILKL